MNVSRKTVVTICIISIIIAFVCVAVQTYYTFLHFGAYALLFSGKDSMPVYILMKEYANYRIAFFVGLVSSFIAYASAVALKD